jgi:hypothetical protein
MKIWGVFAIVGAGMLSVGCGEDPVGPGSVAGRYAMVAFYDQPLPIVTDSATVVDGAQSVRCANTLVSEEIVLSSDWSATRTTRSEFRCPDGVVRFPRTFTLSGSYRTDADTVRLKLVTPNAQLANFTLDLVHSGNRLVMATTIYTEAQPDSGPQKYTIWQKQ